MNMNVLGLTRDPLWSDDFAVFLGKRTSVDAKAYLSPRAHWQDLKEASTQIEKLGMKLRDYTD
jgi:hypothetical protein